MIELTALDVTGARPPIDLSSGLDVDRTYSFSGIAHGILLSRITSFTDEDRSLRRTDLYRILLGSPAQRVNADFPRLAMVDEVSLLDMAPGAGRGACRTGGRELFGFALDGTTAARLDSPGLGHVVQFRASPDGRRVVFLQDATAFVAPLDGSAAPLALAPANSIDLVTADGARAILDLVGGAELRSVRLDGAEPAVTLGPTGGTERKVLASPDSLRVVWTSDLDNDGLGEVYSAPIDGSALAVELAPWLPKTVVQDVRVTPDGQSVVLLRGSHAGPSALVRVPIAGGAAPQLLALLGFAARWEIAPSGDRVVYVDDVAGELRSVPLSGGPTTLLSQGTVQPFQLELAGDRVVFLANPRGGVGALEFDVFASPADGSAGPLQLNQRSAGDGAFAGINAGWLAVDAAGEHALFSELDRTVAAALDGSSFAVLADFVARAYPAPGGDRVVLGRRGTAGRMQLFGAALDGSSLRAPTPGADARELERLPFAPAATGVVFLADLDEEGVDELYLGVLGRPVRLAPPPR